MDACEYAEDDGKAALIKECVDESALSESDDGGMFTVLHCLNIVFCLFPEFL